MYVTTCLPVCVQTSFLQALRKPKVLSFEETENLSLSSEKDHRVVAFTLNPRTLQVHSYLITEVQKTGTPKGIMRTPNDEVRQIS